MIRRCAQLAVLATVWSPVTSGAWAQTYPQPQPYWTYGDTRPRYLRPFREDDRFGPPPSWREAPPGWHPRDSAPRRFHEGRESDRYARPTPPPLPATPIAPYERPRAAAEPLSTSNRDGGPRPEIRPAPPQMVPLSSSYSPGTVVIETHGRQLLVIVTSRTALRYPISVGREGFQWTGTEKISRVADWPDWHPPAQMRKRDPSLPVMMTGGIRNPLGAKALYLGNSLYRIHGTNDPRTVGFASSSGCFRMLNGHVVDLAGRVGVGSPVVVIDRLPRSAFAERSERERPPPVSR